MPKRQITKNKSYDFPELRPGRYLGLNQTKLPAAVTGISERKVTQTTIVTGD